MSINYTVSVHPFAERHFIKAFSKKYKGHWEETWVSVEAEFRNPAVLIEKDIAEVIVAEGDIQLCKTKFRVAKTQSSRHSSGNRCIIAVDTKKRHVAVLLVYTKTDLPGSGNETAKWKNIIRKQYPEYGAIL